MAASATRVGKEQIVHFLTAKIIVIIMEGAIL
jgi:hypothetical protein